VNRKLIYVDSNIFIRPIISDQDYSEAATACKKVLSAIENGKVVAYTSALTWDEVVYVVRKVLGKADSTQSGEKFLKFPNLRFISVSEDIIRAAQRIVTESDVLPRAAIHVASAQKGKAEVIISDDSDFDAIEGVKREGSETFAHA